MGSSSSSMMPVGQVPDLADRRHDVGLRHHEGVAVARVEAGGQVPAELQVLALVLPHRHPVRLVEQDVRGHQHRIGEQADGGALGAQLGRLVLELGHPLRLPEAGQAAEDPRQLGVFGYVRLQEHHRALGVHASGDHLRGAAQRAVRQGPRVGLDGQRMQVRDPVERLVVVLQRHPLPQRTQEVAEVQGVGGGLGEGEDPRRTRGQRGGHAAHSDTRPRTRQGSFCSSGTRSSGGVSSRCTTNADARRPSSSLTLSSSRASPSAGFSPTATSATTTSPSRGS